MYFISDPDNAIVVRPFLPINPVSMYWEIVPSMRRAQSPRRRHDPVAQIDNWAILLFYLPVMIIFRRRRTNKQASKPATKFAPSKTLEEKGAFLSSFPPSGLCVVIVFRFVFFT